MYNFPKTAKPITYNNIITLCGDYGKIRDHIINFLTNDFKPS